MTGSRRARAGATAGDPPTRHRSGVRDLEADLLPNRSYPSQALWRMTRALRPDAPPARVLDLGPTRNANIRFWTDRGFSVSCYDLLAHELEVLGDAEITPLTLARESLRRRRLPFEERSFSAVCCWSVLGQMPFLLAQRYAQECHRVLAPSGLLHAVFLDVEGRPEARRHYEIVDRQTLRVFTTPSRRRGAGRWIDAEIQLILARFGACEILPAAAATREVLAQRAPMVP